MFQVWEDVATASIGFNRIGDLLPTGAFTDGNVSTIAEFNAVEGSCNSGTQNPIVYDQDGSLFNALFGSGTNVIGFAGVCAINNAGRIVAAEAALNGRFRDGNAGNGELTDNEFDAVFIHEFGHFFGLDHSQINLNCLGGGCADFSDDAFGLPTMFPFLLSGLEETPGVHPARTLSVDDRAWVSRLYPAPSFSTTHGTITGTILFSDGVTHAQGVNVLARQLDDPGTPAIDESRRNVVSVISGFLFTGNTGQSITGTNTGGSSLGSRTPLQIGAFEMPIPAAAGGTSYTVEVESLEPGFTAGSSVGPLDPPIANPGPNEFWNVGESNSDNPATSSPTPPVTPGGTVPGIDIILNGTPTRFDSFESALLRLPDWLGCEWQKCVGAL
jgi:hypothetical protein